MSNIGNYNGSSSQGDSAMVINEKLRPIHAEVVGDYLHIASSEYAANETNNGYTFTHKHRLFDVDGSPQEQFGSFVTSGTYYQEKTFLPSKVQQLYGNKFIVQGLAGETYNKSSVFGKIAYGITSHNLDGSINQSFTPIKTTNSMLPYITCGLSTGKMLVGGSAVKSNGRYHTGIYRLNGDGSVDDTFNIGGLGFDISSSTAMSSIYNTVTDIIELSDGRFAVAHSCSEYNGTKVNGSRCLIISADGVLVAVLDTNTIGTENPIRLFEFGGKLFIFYGFSGQSMSFDLSTFAIDTTYTLPNVSFSSGYGKGIDKFGGDLFLTDNAGGFKKYIGGLTLDDAFPVIAGTFRGILSNGNLLFDLSVGSYGAKYAVYSSVDGTLITSRTVNYKLSGWAYHHGFARTATGFYTVIARGNEECQIIGFNNDLSDIPGFNNICLSWGGFVRNPEPEILTIAGDMLIHTMETNQAIDEKRNHKKPYVIIDNGNIVHETTPFLDSGVIEDTCIVDDGTIIAGDFIIDNSVGVAKLDVNMQVDNSFVVGAVGGKVNSVNKLSDDNFLISGGFKTLNPPTTRGNSLIASDGTKIVSSNLGNYDVFDLKINQDGTYWCILNTGFGSAKLVKLLADLTLDVSFAEVTILDTTGEINYVKCFGDQSGNVYVYGNITTVNSHTCKIAKISNTGIVDVSYLYVPLVDVSGAVFANNFLYVLESSGGFYKLNPDGSVETTFDTIVPGIGDTYLFMRGYTHIADIDGKLYIGGSFTNCKYNGQIVNDLICVNYDGSLDSGFSSGSGVFGFIHDIKPLSTDKLVLSGRFQNYSIPTNRATAVFDVNGNIEPFRFLFENDETSTNQRYQHIAKQSDGKYIVTGYFTKVWDGKTFVARPHIARLNLDGTLDDTFNTGVTTAFNNSTSLSIYIDEQDRIYVFGNFTSYRGVSTGNVRIIRLLPNGDKDTSFVTGAGFNALVSNIAVDATGIYCVGDFSTYKGVAAKRICKIDFDGNRITTFAVGTGFTAPNSTSWYPNITVGGDGYVYVCGLSNTIYKGVSSTSMVAKLDALTATRDDSFVLNIDGVVITTIVDNGYIWCSGLISGIKDVDALYYPAPGLVKYSLAGTIDKTLANFVNIGFNTSAEIVAYNTDNGTTANIQDFDIIGNRLLLSGYFTKFGSIVSNNIVIIDNNGAAIKTFVNQANFIGAADSVSVLDGKFYLSNFNAILTEGIMNKNLVVIDRMTGQLDTTYNYASIHDCFAINSVAIVGTDIFYACDGKIFKYNETSLLSDEPVIEYIVDMYVTPVVTNMLNVSGNILVSGNIRYANSREIKQLAIIDAAGTQVVNTLIGNDFNEAVLCSKEVLPGKIVCVGDFTMYGAVQANKIIMLLVDGTIDTSFVYGTGFNGSVKCVTILDTHKIVCEGTFTNYNGVDTNGMIALNPDGTVYYNYSIASAEGLNYGSVLYRNKQVLYGRKMLTASNTIADVSIGFMEPTGKFELTRSSSELNTATYGNIIELVELANGKYIAATEYGYLMRLKADLSVDETVTPKSVSGSITSIVAHTNGNIIVGGSFYEYDSIKGFDNNGDFVMTDDYATPVVNSCNNIMQIDTDLKMVNFAVGSSLNDTIVRLAVSSGKIYVLRNGYSSDTFDGTAIGTLFVLNSDGTLDTGFDSAAAISLEFDTQCALAIKNGHIYVSDKMRSIRGIAVYDLLGNNIGNIVIPTNNTYSYFQPKSIAFDSVGNIVCVGDIYDPKGNNTTFVKIDGTTLKPIVSIIDPKPSSYASLTNVLCISDNLFVAGSYSIWFADGNMNILDDMIRRTGNYIKPVLINQSGQIVFISSSDTTVIEIEPKHSYIRQCDMNGNILSAYRGR